MIYFFRAISNESDDFLFDIAINASAKFIDLHNFIQQKLNFDSAQLTSFFITDEAWQKEQEITLIDMTGDGSIGVMDQITLDTYLDRPKQRMLYTFDPFAERVLFMELTHITEGEVKEPAAVRLEGTAPTPFLDENFDLDSDESESYDYDDGDDFSGLDDEFPEDYADDSFDFDDY